MIPVPSREHDQHLTNICVNSVAILEHAANAFADAHVRDISLGALALINDAVQKIRLAERMLQEAR